MSPAEQARRLLTINAAVFTLAWISAAALLVAAYGVWRAHDIQMQLCNTINAGRRPDAGLKVDDPNAINVREQLRLIWQHIGEPEIAKAVPNASLIDCRTGKPLGKEDT